MPDFGGHHGAQGITAITAFVTQLPALTADGYARLTVSGHHEDSAGCSESQGEAAPEPD